MQRSRSKKEDKGSKRQQDRAGKKQQPQSLCVADTGFL
jgi:hypothetical protein